MPVMVVTNVFQGRPESFGLKVLARLLAEEPGVISMKEDLQNEFARRSALLVHPRWTVFSAGGLRNHLNMIHFGCDGFMDRHLNFAPRVTARYWDAVQRQDWDAAVAEIEQIEVPLEEHMGEYPGSRDAAIHGLLEIAGVCGRWRRPPYHSLTDAEMSKLAAFAKQLGLFN
jgi:dihydrodipicolinate synthase/N-acetylneuraminate lyase